MQEAGRFAGRRHQPADLLVGLDDSAHVVMEGHAYAELGHVLGEPCEAAAVVGPVAVGSRGRREIGAKRSPSDRPEVSA